ncbi:MAG: recombinase family protein [Candidatus Eremiobacteraeota bacterium]|nr:recombinase family protein [Candidatus Eremiobacteraeota bacterium]
MGYARVSTDDQKLGLQLDALKGAGCTKIFRDEASGAARSRPGLDTCLAALRPGDVLVVWRLDRLGRSLAHLLSIVEGLRDRDVGLRSLTESIDTTSAGGKLIFSIFGALAEYERAMISERVRAGMRAAKKRGANVGRRAALTPTALTQARRLIAAGESISDVARSMRCGVSTLYRALGRDV